MIWTGRTSAAPNAPQGRFSLQAHLEKDGAMTLSVNANIVARAKAPGLFTTQPANELSIGQDVLSAVGDYASPGALRGRIENVVINGLSASFKRQD